MTRCVCGSNHFTEVYRYDAPPPGEVHFEFASAGSYHRTIQRCDLCGHFLSVHAMDTSALYTKDYVSSVYGSADGIRKAFERITALDPASSDNVGRAARVKAFAETRGGTTPTLLDVGSGLAVFVHRMKSYGWRCTALDPDPRSAEHARKTVGVEALCGDFNALDLSDRYDVVTLNKVLEHVEAPTHMLGKALSLAARFVYVEVPDGESAAKDGPEREEFFIDHLHVFSAASLALVIANAGGRLREMERLREPSGKYTLRGFAER